MMPVIRIDEEVFAWLQTSAKPLVDTPNSVLRRLAGLDSDEDLKTLDVTAKEGVKNQREQQIRGGDNQMNGKELNERWGVRARHALYHREGTWYNNLERFPGALFDQHGYILLETERHYRESPYIKVTKQTNVPNGISSIPSYVRKNFD